jgi:hypothetical protein
MSTLHGTMPYDRGEERPCVWCGRPTDIRFIPEFRPDLGPLPLHMMCGVLLIRAYERVRAGQIIDIYSRTRLDAVAHAATSANVRSTLQDLQ